MATEEVELTFIRCPGCKSLVPAIASRCRMCGQTLQKADEPANLAKAEISHSKSPTLENIEEVIKENNSVDQDVADVVDDYEVDIEKDFEENLGISKLSDPTPESKPEPKDEKPFRFLGQGNDQIRIKSEESSFAQKEDFSRDRQEQNAFGEDVDPAKKKRKRRRKKKKPAESGTSEFVSLQNQSSEKEKPRQEISREPRFEINREARGNENRDLKSDERYDNWRNERPEPSKQEAREIVKPKIEVLKEEPIEVKKVFEEEIIKEEIKVKELITKSEDKTVQATKKASAGELIGWFVTYGDNKKGEAIEIRSGRFFISSGKVREDDMIVNHDSISTPHCLVKSGADGIQIQDLMSEAGTFVSKAGSKDYLQLLESAKLAHGDSVKFGEYEVLVCLVPPKN